MSDPDGVETNLAAFAEVLPKLSGRDLYALVEKLEGNSQDALIIREALLRVLDRSTNVRGWSRAGEL